MIYAAILGPAYADDAARAWETLYDARLVEAMDGTPEVAAMYYEETVGELADTDPLYGVAWYWLGRTRYVLGDIPAAVTALERADDTPEARAPSTALLARIELERHAILACPVALSFDRGTGPFVRAWEQADKGELSTRTAEGRTTLAWGTTVRSGQPDHIAAAFQGGQPLTSIGFEVRSAEFPAELRVTLTDGAGVRYSAPVFQVPTGWLDITLPVTEFRSSEAAHSAGGNALRSGDRVRLVEIEDLTGVLTPERGENTLYIDSFELR